jgi:hypothetical protein
LDHGGVDVVDNFDGMDKDPANQERHLDAAYCADDMTNVFFHQSQKDNAL